MFEIKVINISYIYIYAMHLMFVWLFVFKGNYEVIFGFHVN